MNVILVILNSLRKDCLEIYGALLWGRVYTPHFEAFAWESLVQLQTRWLEWWYNSRHAGNNLYTTSDKSGA